MSYLARILNNTQSQLLSEHLKGVAHLTSTSLPKQFEQVGWYAGLWHDLGKYIDKWQKYLIHETARVTHSTQGAMLALELCENPDIVPAIGFVIAGHHAGLKNPTRLESQDFELMGANYKEALRVAKQEIENFVPQHLPDIELPTLRREFAIRMLFSALVDSDRLDAMRFEQKCQNLQNMEVQANVDLQSSFNPRSFRFDPHVLPAAVSEIDKLRNVFAQHCISNAGSTKGLFRLTGTCGIGKTQSSLRFALIHAEVRSCRGVIYVGLLKSIIEQTANVYRTILGEANVLEHHSGFEPKLEENKSYKLNTERWDKPVIVTSGVQFYESLFSNSPSQCRKLHNIANRVILIDEAQTIPQHLVIPILDVLKTLVDDWGCTVVLMSATQPAFDRLNNVPFDAVDIVPAEAVNEQFQALQRTTYNLQINTSWDWSDLAQDINSSGFNQSLTVVNTTKLSRDGYQQLSNLVSGFWFHLSARMCPAHRVIVLQQVRERLDKNLPCHLISTQLVEAGVDIDFPRVYRQLGPLDSIIQTTGRCNRNNKLNKNNAVVTVFNLEGASIYPGDYRNRIEITRAILQQNPNALNEDILISIQKYFRQVFNDIHAGGTEIQKLRCGYDYPKVAEKFKVIDNDWQQTVVVPWEGGIDLINELRNKDILSQNDWQQLQKYTIALPNNCKEIVEQANGLKIWNGEYNQEFGAYLIE